MSRFPGDYQQDVRPLLSRHRKNATLQNRCALCQWPHTLYVFLKYLSIHAVRNSSLRKSSMREKEHKAPEIPEAIRKYLSDAKRHHIVPEFLLRRFSMDPGTEHPQIYRLDVKTGVITTHSTKDCAVIQHYNRLSAASGLPAGFAEAMLAYTDDHAASLVGKLLRGELLDMQERVTFSNFLMAQQMRTPRGREWARFGQNQAAKYWVLKQLCENRGRAKEFLREDLGRSPTEDEIDQFILRVEESLEGGELTVSITSDQEILGMFVPAPDIVPLIGEMNWTVLKASAGHSFILSDDPLVRLDERTPGGPAGWRASPTIEATMPLDPHYCLLLRQPPLAQSLRVASADHVRDINYRTYAWARESIFGPTKELLESVFAAAQANMYRVERYRPTPPAMYVVERIEGEEKPSNVTRIPGPSEIKIRRNRKDA